MFLHGQHGCTGLYNCPMMPKTLSFWAQNPLALYAPWASCPLVLKLINAGQSPFMTIFSPPNWPSLTQGSNLGHTCSIKTIQGNMFICFGFRTCICENMGGCPYYHGLKIYIVNSCLATGSLVQRLTCLDYVNMTPV